MNQTNEQKGSLIKLFHYCRKYLPLILIALIGASIGTVLTLFGPDKLSEMTDLITGGLFGSMDLEAIADIGWTLVIIYGVSFILSLGQGLIMANITQRISKQLRTALSDKVNKLPMAYYNNTTTGDILSRVTNDIDTIGQTLNQSIGMLVTAMCLFIGSLIMMFKTNVIMSLTAILSILLGFVLMMLLMKTSQKYFLSQQESLGAINGHVEEVYSGHFIVKAYNGENQMREAFETINENLRDSAYKAQFLSGLMMPMMMFIGNLGYVAVCIVGAVLAMNDKISFGVIVAFIMYIRYFTQPLAQMAQAAQSLQSASAASHRVFEFLEAEEMEDERHKQQKLTSATGKVEFKKCSILLFKKWETCH